MRRVDPEHGGALAHGRRQEIDLLVRLPTLEAVDEVQLGTDAPDGPRLPGGHSSNDELGGATGVGQVDDVFVALRVHDDLDAGMLLAEVADVHPEDRKSTRLNSSHTVISYAVFCLKKKTRPPPIRLVR